jgi:putative ABC transport system permease protein
MFPFGLGVSVVALWAAVSLRYYHIHERLSFTVTSAALLVLWYLLPGGRLEWLTGKLTGDVEMFFLSGATLVTAGTFIVVYNADIILPLVARVGSRFGRLVPAIKTAVAYPLTSRFRTGLTIAMIGLIMFVLSMQSALNTNFAKAFSSEDALGGFDVRVQVNGNNRTDQLIPAITEGNKALPAEQQADPAKIRAAAEVRSASPFEVNIKDPQAKVTDLTKEWKQYLILGVDDTFVDNQKLPLEFRAAGYADDNAVWQAVKSGKNFAIIPAALTAGNQGFGPPTGVDEPLELDADRMKAGFEPFTLTMRDPGTKQETQITVIGQMKATCFRRSRSRRGRRSSWRCSRARMRRPMRSTSKRHSCRRRPTRSSRSSTTTWRSTGRS